MPGRDERWIDLDGVRNMRDLGGLATEQGSRTARHRLIRSDNLRALSASAVRELVQTHRVRAVADLRTDVEIAADGPGPFADVADVDVQHLSLFRPSPDASTITTGEPVRLPWTRDDGSAQPVVDVYLGYLEDRADSVIAALRLIARSPGSTIVHCAAGKDRTGMICAWALAEVGVTRAEIVDDYAMSADRIALVLTDLRSQPAYRDDFVQGLPDSSYAPRTNTMEEVLDTVDREHGGIPRWLRTHGWTKRDAAALRAKLIERQA